MKNEEMLAIDALIVRKKANVTEIEIGNIMQDPSTMEEVKCCGSCCWFYGKDSDGEGSCAMHEYDGDELPWYYDSSLACPEHTSRKEMRHHMAVLLRHNRWRRSDEWPNRCHMVNPTEIGRAIDFAVKYMKVFSKL